MILHNLPSVVKPWSLMASNFTFIKIETVHYFPLLIMILQICAALVYLYQGDYRHFFYYAFATGIIASVTI